MNVRVPEQIFEDIAAAVAYSEENFGKTAAGKLGRLLFAALERTATNYGKQVLDAPRNYRYMSIPPYNLFYRINEQANEVVVYALRHQRSEPLGFEQHERLADVADRDAHILPSDNND